MFRMSKDPSTVSITVFREGEEPYSMNYGSSTTLVSENMKKIRNLVMECVNLDFGIFTHGGRGAFKQSVEATLGHRDPYSPKNYELQRAGDRYSLFVNDQHIVVTRPADFESWLEERGLALEIQSTRNTGLCPVDFGKMMRVDVPGRTGMIKNGVVYPGQSGQGLIFKDETAFSNKEGVCYIPERGLDLATKTPDGGYLLAECDSFTYEQILQACDGNEEAAKQVFEGLDWQYPETLFLESQEDFSQEVPLVEARAFADAIDKAFDSFLGKTGWQGLDTPSAVAEFVRFAKHDMEPSLDDLMNRAKEKAAEKNDSRLDQPKEHKSRENER